MAFETVKAGWLHRQKTITKKWKRQWFVLTTDGMLRYFDKEYSSSAEDAVRMKLDCNRITTDNNINYALAPPTGMSRNCLIQIEFKSKTWNLCAESPDDMTAWHMALEDSRILDAAQNVRGAVAPPVRYPQQAQVIQYPAANIVQTSYPANNVVYVNGNQPYMYPNGATTQQVIHHPNGNQTVIVNNQPQQRYYGSRYSGYGHGYGLGPLWW